MDQQAGETPLIGIFTTDNDLIVRVWDDAVSSMTGIPASDSIGKHLTELIPNLAGRGLLPRFERARDLGTTEVLAPAFHKFLIPCPPSGPTEYFDRMQQLVRISALRKDEQVCGVVVVLEDVTARLERERSLAKRLADPDDRIRMEAAKEISSGEEPLSPESSEAVIGALGDRNWRVRRRLVEGLSRRLAPESVTALLNAVRDEHLDFGLLNSALQVLQATSVDTTRSLVDFLNGDEPDLRVQAALALGEHRNPDAVPELIQALGDEDANVRYHAIEALGKIKAPTAVEPLLAIAETRDFFLAYPALDALGKIGAGGIADRLVPLLDDEDLREAAVETLGAVGGPAVVERIITLLNEGKISAAAVASAVTTLLDRQEDEPERRRMIELIGAALRPSGVDAIGDALEPAIGATLSTVIRCASLIQDEKIRKRLSDLADNDQYRTEALEALAAQGDTALPHLVGRLGSDDPEVRKAAVRALAGFKSSTAVDALIGALDLDPDTAAAAAAALGTSSSPAAMNALIELLSTAEPSLQRSAANALRSMARGDMSLRLCALLGDADARTKESIIRIIGGIGNAECGEAVLAASQDENERVRAAAFEQLQNFEGEAVVSALIAGLGDEAPAARAAAARSLGHFDGEQPRRALRAALGDADAWTRYFAVRALAAARDRESYEILKKLSEDDEAEQVRVAAAEALAAN